MTDLEKYYNKFNEEKRLDSRHGRVEFFTSMQYIHEAIEEIREGRDNSELKILDIGAATGKYCVPLSEEGFSLTAVELVKHNLGILKKKSSAVRAFQGNALDLRRFPDQSFDLSLLFGPMYHLHDRRDKLKALCEARRMTKRGGRILVAYLMNEFAVITYAFKEKHILEAMEKDMLDEDFHCNENANPLYSMVRLEDIASLNMDAGLKRRKIIAADGAANYLRPYLNALTEEEFQHFIDYHLRTCERMDLMGASGHTVDILEVL